MKDKEISNVILVENPSPKQEIWRPTSRQSMKTKAITNVILVENPSPKQEVWRHTSRLFMRARNIKNVNSVGSHIKLQIIWKYTSQQFMMARRIKIVTFAVNHFLQRDLWWNILKNLISKSYQDHKISNSLLIFKCTFNRFTVYYIPIWNKSKLQTNTSSGFSSRF